MELKEYQKKTLDQVKIYLDSFAVDEPILNSRLGYW